jgi:hypothetical protein
VRAANLTGTGGLEEGRAAEGRRMSVSIFDEARTIGVSRAGILQDSVKEPQSFGLGIHQAN